MNYQSASEKLTGRNKESRKVANHTYLQRRDAETIAVKLHATDVVTFKSDGRVILNTGGWKTVTTKERMNSFAGLQVSSDKGVWYVSNNGFASNVPFADGITYQDGKFSGLGEDPRATIRARERVRKFARDYVEELKAQRMRAPDGGDCWFCLMFSRDGAKPSASHLESHIQEKYFVPSLMRNALDWRGSQVNKWLVAGCWRLAADANDAEALQAVKSFGQEWQWKQITKTLAQYMFLQMAL